MFGENSDNTVSVHVRRTDFVSLKWTDDSTVSFYFAAINYFREKLDNPVFYIFSDDISWTKKVFGKEEDCIVIDSFGGEVQSLYDMYCMAACKNHILTKKSTYSKWASLLGTGEQGLNICQASGDAEHDKFEYANLEVLFFDEDMINRYGINKCDFEKNENVMGDIDYILKEIENDLINDNNQEALKKITELTFKRNIEVTSPQRDYVLEYRALAYFQLGEYELSIDSLRSVVFPRDKYDYLYNYSMNLEMIGNHIEALCYASIASQVNYESDIKDFIYGKSDEEKLLERIIEQACLKCIFQSRVKIVFIVSYYTASINKQIISVAMLLKKLGFDVVMWRNGIDSENLLTSYISPYSIIVTNMPDNCVKVDGTKLITYKSSGAADADVFFSIQYGNERLQEMMEKSDLYIAENIDSENISQNQLKMISMACENNNIIYSADEVLNWDTCVNSDEKIWLMCSILLGIITKI